MSRITAEGLQEHLGRQDGWRTVEEIAAATGAHPNPVKALLTKLERRGIAERSGDRARLREEPLTVEQAVLGALEAMVAAKAAEDPGHPWVSTGALARECGYPIATIIEVMDGNPGRAEYGWQGRKITSYGSITTPEALAVAEEAGQRAVREEAEHRERAEAEEARRAQARTAVEEGIQAVVDLVWPEGVRAAELHDALAVRSVVAPVLLRRHGLDQDEEAK